MTLLSLIILSVSCYNAIYCQNSDKLKVLPKIIKYSDIYPNFSKTNLQFLSSESKIYAYFGIPFAVPPVGDLRFRKPLSLGSEWIHKYQINEQKSKCIQLYNPNVHIPWQYEGPYSEDCLYLNIWTPCLGHNCKLPVMVWIYGGGFVTGTIYTPLYDGKALSAYGNIVVVTVQYRLNALGFLYVNSSSAPGNQGLWDQRLALEWIRDNIHIFGGDHTEVTLFGESAGGFSIGAHLLSDDSKILFKRAITESGIPVIINFLIANTTTAFAFSKTFVKHLKCMKKNSVIDWNCLRSLSPQLLSEKFSDLSPTLGYNLMVYGDEFLKDNPNLEFIRGKLTNTNLLMGCNANEGHIVAYAFYTNQFENLINNNFTKNQILTLSRNAISLYFGNILQNDLKRILNYYYGNVNQNDYEKLRQSFYDIISDTIFVCPLLFFAGNANNFGKNTAYFYFFNQNTSYNEFGGWYQSTHFQEIQYVFGMPFLHPNIYTDDERKLSYDMMKIWTSFARYGKPQSPRPLKNNISWPIMKDITGKYVVLNSKSSQFSIGTHLNDRCRLWIELKLKYLNIIN